jgi:PAS domain-containing protein
MTTKLHHYQRVGRIDKICHPGANLSAFVTCSGLSPIPFLSEFWPDCAVLRQSCGRKCRGMSPLQQSTSGTHKNQGNARCAVECQPPLPISTGQISPANQHHQSSDLFTRERRWRAVFENSAIGVTTADLDGHGLAANSVFQKMACSTETVRPTCLNGSSIGN